MVSCKLLTGLLCLVAAAQGFRAVSTSPLRREALRQRDLQSRAAAKLSYVAYNVSTPVDHFHNESKYEPHSDAKFGLRYWFDAQHYKPGGPVIVLAGGETSGTDRFPFLQKGILAQLASATNGIGVILEHRYYGGSWPTPDLSTESLRFLTTDQSVADAAYFAQNVEFPGFEGVDLTARTTPYIAYGGSYAGAFVAILRKVYPDVYWGAISSSGVTEAVWDYFDYFKAAFVYGPPECVATTQKLQNVVDNILMAKDQHPTVDVATVKAAFGLPNVTDLGDFASVIKEGIEGLQGLNWDPAVSDNTFFDYCGNVSSDAVEYNDTESLRDTAKKMIAAGGWGAESDKLTTRMLNWIGFVKSNFVSSCDEANQDKCFGSKNSTFYHQDDIDQDWRSWPYQYCTEWGYLQTGSGWPNSSLPLISRLIDLPYTSTICREAFNLTQPASVELVNKFGGLDIAYPRLAIVDGEWDPWRAVTPHALGQPGRQSTASEPFVLIDGGVHHWDENGVFANETMAGLLPPASVAGAQAVLREAVLCWVEEWKNKGTTDEFPREEL